jgi:predicted peptidase
VSFNYTGEKNVPLILFLHGYDKTGTDGDQPTTAGIGPVIKKNPKAFPFFVLFPQSQEHTWKGDSKDGKRAVAILDEVENDYKIDANRVYLTGLSMGGLGTWSLAESDPKRWAAIVPICGGIGKTGPDPEWAATIKDVPCWCFHGGADPVVPVQLSRTMVFTMKKVGGHPVYTEFPGVDHQGCWERAYGNSDLYRWLLKHSRKGK